MIVIGAEAAKVSAARALNGEGGARLVSLAWPSCSPPSSAGAGDPLALARRHVSIFAAYHSHSPGAGFVLVNDRDPRPLR